MSKQFVQKKEANLAHFNLATKQKNSNTDFNKLTSSSIAFILRRHFKETMQETAIGTLPREAQDCSL